MVDSPSASVVNQALMVMGGNQPPVTGAAPNFDNTTAGKSAAQLYEPCVKTVLRSFQWDCARRTSLLVTTGNVAPFPWDFEFVYPADAVQVWQLTPTAEADPYDPLPVNYTIANALVAGAQARVIQTNLSPANAVYNNRPSETIWDSGLREAVVRLLASELAIAIGGKPDTSQVLLTSAGSFEQAAEARRD